MSDHFVPLNQSTPTGGKWNGRDRYFKNNLQQNSSLNGQRRGNNRWRNNSRNSSFGSDSNNSMSQGKGNIDVYLHPCMLQDPWVPLRKWLEENKKIQN